MSTREQDIVFDPFGTGFTDPRLLAGPNPTDIRSVIQTRTIPLSQDAQRARVTEEDVVFDPFGTGFTDPRLAGTEQTRQIPQTRQEGLIEQLTPQFVQDFQAFRDERNIVGGAPGAFDPRNFADTDRLLLGESFENITGREAPTISQDLRDRPALPIVGPAGVGVVGAGQALRRGAGAIRGVPRSVIQSAARIPARARQIAPSRQQLLLRGERGTLQLGQFAERAREAGQRARQTLQIAPPRGPPRNVGEPFAETPGTGAPGVGQQRLRVARELDLSRAIGDPVRRQLGSASPGVSAERLGVARELDRALQAQALERRLAAQSEIDRSIALFNRAQQPQALGGVGAIVSPSLGFAQEQGLQLDTTARFGVTERLPTMQFHQQALGAQFQRLQSRPQVQELATETGLESRLRQRNLNIQRRLGPDQVERQLNRQNQQYRQHIRELQGFETRGTQRPTTGTQVTSLQSQRPISTQFPGLDVPPFRTEFPPQRFLPPRFPPPFVPRLPPLPLGGVGGRRAGGVGGVFGIQLVTELPAPGQLDQATQQTGVAAAGASTVAVQQGDRVVAVQQPAEQSVQAGETVQQAQSPMPSEEPAPVPVAAQQATTQRAMESSGVDPVPNDLDDPPSTGNQEPSSQPTPASLPQQSPPPAETGLGEPTQFNDPTPGSFNDPAPLTAEQQPPELAPPANARSTEPPRLDESSSPPSSSPPSDGGPGDPGELPQP